MMITGENPENIRLVNSLSEDRFSGDCFDSMITNHPYGVSWKSDKRFVENDSQNPNGRFSVGTPRISNGQLLFLQHMISKMEGKGSRIGIVFNGSPIFTGDSGSGESEIRKWIIENDWLECIVSLPDQLFFNTGITAYLWILSNKKSERRQGKVQLIDGSSCIDGSSLFVQMKKSLGNKRKEIPQDKRDEIVRLYLNFEEDVRCQIHPNEFFGYTKVQIEQPLIEDGKVVTDRRGNPKPDTSKRDQERVPLQDDVDGYYEREVTIWSRIPLSTVNFLISAL
jgi:type I restriction enzyme M protein